MVEAPTSDVPLGMPKEPNPYMEHLKEVCKDVAAFEKDIPLICKEIGELVDWRYHFDPEKPGFNPSLCADRLLDRHKVVTDKETEVVYFYDSKKGIYRKDGEQILKVIVDLALGPENRISRVTETVGLVKIKTYAAIKLSPRIAVHNGVLDPETATITPFKDLDFITNRLDVEYKPEAKCPKWTAFIEQVCPNDRLLLQEWSGYLLLRDYRFHAIMWIYGPTGRNGKGVWARTMQSILGEENYTSVSIDEFDGKHRFALYRLYGSLFNICSEPRTDRNLTIELLQMLSGDDSIDAEKKGVQNTLRFKNTAKVTVMGNKFPQVKKPTDAFWERLKLCKFPNRFIGTDQIPQVEKTWLNDPEERSGILNWMLEGLQRLLKNGCFTLTKTQEETILEFKRASDSIGAFLTEGVDYEAKTQTTRVDAYNHYKSYCELIGIPAESDKDFCQALKNDVRIRDTSARVQGKKARVWAGISLRELPSEDEDSESGTDGTDGTPVCTQRGKEVSLEKYSDVVSCVPSVPSVPKLTHSATNCDLWQKGGCQFPGDPYSVKADASWCGQCKSWVERVLPKKDGDSADYPEPGEGL